MRCYIRRLIIFPIFMVGAPIIYFIAWCIDGTDAAKEITCECILATWGD